MKRRYDDRVDELIRLLARSRRVEKARQWRPKAEGAAARLPVARTAMKPLPPYKLRRWQISLPDNPSSHDFFTCARPGRTKDAASKEAKVPDELVHRWVLGLPRRGRNIAIISLLGCKPDGLSEFSFYSFYGGFDAPSDCPGRPHFQDWLNQWHPDLNVWLREHPTRDFDGIELDVLDAIASDVCELLQGGRTVVLLDSGGETRTGMVCRHMHAQESTGRDRGHEIVQSANIAARSVESKYGTTRGPEVTSAGDLEKRLAKRSHVRPIALALRREGKISAEQLRTLILADPDTEKECAAIASDLFRDAKIGSREYYKLLDAVRRDSKDRMHQTYKENEKAVIGPSTHLTRSGGLPSLGKRRP